jgi:hypothetical protein
LSGSKIELRPRKRLGRMRRGAKLGLIVPLRGEELASKCEGEAGKPEEP